MELHPSEVRPEVEKEILGAQWSCNLEGAGDRRGMRGPEVNTQRDPHLG